MAESIRSRLIENYTFFLENSLIKKSNPLRYMNPLESCRSLILHWIVLLTMHRQFLKSLNSTGKELSESI